MCLSCTIEEVTGFDLSTGEGIDALDALDRIPWPEATREMKEAAAYIAALYANPAGGVGGPLHIVTDDYNVNDENLIYCREHIHEWTGYDTAAQHDGQVRSLSYWILDLLDPMDTKERSVTIALAHGQLHDVHGKIFMPAIEIPLREDIRDEEGNYVGWQWGFKSRVVGAK